MSSKGIVWLLGISSLFIGVIQVIALRFFLYWTVWWLDIVMHFLGGFWVALIVLWFYKAFVKEKAKSDHGYLLALLGVIIVGIAWEVFEVLADTAHVRGNYLFDTVGDLIMDTVGALVAAYIVFRKSIIEVTDRGHE